MIRSYGGELSSTYSQTLNIRDKPLNLLAFLNWALACLNCRWERVKAGQLADILLFSGPYLVSRTGAVG